MAGLLEESVAEYQRALAIEPDYASAHNNLGSVLSATGGSIEAFRHFGEAVRLDPANVQAIGNSRP